MTITAETIVEIAKILGASGTILGVLIAFIKWLQKQEKQSVDIESLHNLHSTDIEKVQEELCVVDYAILAALDALKQQGYNGKVTEAHDKIDKYLNQKAHNQRENRNG